ncbi:MAG: bifunctional phosphoribosyl-AMP cyclohydrolase/phosphoribosyl-ATP diphosphatase HisIE [Chitinophagaceae bacterium]
MTDVNFDKYPDGLVPAIIQDANTAKVLMLGFMNRQSYEKTIAEGKVCFYSRSKQRLWTKGEESGNFLFLKEIKSDCDQDTLLLRVLPAGPVCHTGNDTCWGEKNEPDHFLHLLETIITERRGQNPAESYVASLFAKGINKIAQKVGEEAVEVVIEAKDSNQELFLDESADLLFHYLVLLNAKGANLQDVIDVLRARHEKKSTAAPEKF